MVELALLRGSVAEAAGIDLGEGNIAGAEAGIDGARVEEAADAEAGGDEQDQADGDLQDDEAVAQPGAARAYDLRFVAEGHCEPVAGGAQGWGDSEEDASACGEQ